MHSVTQYLDEDFLFNNSSIHTNIEYKVFLENNKDNTYSSMIEYSYSKCFLVGTFVPDAPGSKMGRVVHLGR